MLKILFFGDITGEPGRIAVKKYLPKIVEEENPDLTLANVENLAHGKGVTIKTLEELIRAGVAGFTSGNHIYSKKDLSNEAFAKHEDILVKPANIPATYPGKEAIIIETPKGNVLIGNFLGQVFMEKQFYDPIDSAFDLFDAWLKRNKPEQTKIVLIDFHAEATSEKIAFGYFADGRITAILGTHTHVPTADAKVLIGGTAYITDVGMCGAADTVLGVTKELSLQRFLTKEHVPFDIPQDPSSAELSYVIIEADETTGKAISIMAKHEILPL